MRDYVNSAALQEYTTKLVAKLKTLFPGTPTAAATVADMTDHGKTYVYVGSETGYTAGDWYYWDGSAWTSGGPFQATSIITDTTLAVAGEAADAKATGDAIAAAKAAVLNAMAPAYSTSATYAVGDYVNYNGSIYRCTTAITTAESWTAGHWTAVVLGADLASQVSDLKNAINEYNNAIKQEKSMKFTHGGIANSDGQTTSGQIRARSNYFKLVPGAIYEVGADFEFVLYEYNLSGNTANYVGVLTPQYITKYKATAAKTVAMVQRHPNNSNITDLSEVKIYQTDPENEFNEQLATYASAGDITGMIIDNTVINVSGNPTSNQYYKSTDFIEVNPGDLLRISGLWGGTIVNNNYTGLFGYDDNKEFVDVIANLETLYGWKVWGVYYTSEAACVVDKESIVIPTGIKYIRMSSRASNSPNAQNPEIIKVFRSSEINHNLKILENKVLNINEYKHLGMDELYFDFEQGTLDATGEVDSSTRIRQGGYLELINDIILICEPGYKVSYRIYSYDGSTYTDKGANAAGWSDRLETIRNLVTGNYIRIAISKSDGSNIVPDEAVNLHILGFNAGTNEYFNNILFHNVCHRGFNTIAPENTIPAFVFARKVGFRWVETDVQFTSDNVPVILHDRSIDRTSNGTGNIDQLTYAEVREYDFGSWKNPIYAGTKIPSFEEFIDWCKKSGVKPYIELKSDVAYTQAQIDILIDIVKSYGMLDQCTWISFGLFLLGYVHNTDPKARLGYLVRDEITQTDVTNITGLRSNNEVFLIPYNSSHIIDTSTFELAIENDIKVEACIIDNTTLFDSMDKTYTGNITNGYPTTRKMWEAANGEM